MKVKCKANKGTALMEKTIETGYFRTTEFSLEIGFDYIVYGIVIARGVLKYLIIGKNTNVPLWYPAELFDVIDNLLPLELYFDYLGGTEVQAIWGYQELIQDESHFDDLAECASEVIEIFLKRKQEIDEQLY